MKPFTDKAICPKCQTQWPTKGTSPRYCSGDDCPLPPITTTAVIDGLEVKTTDAPHLPEHLHCACFNCGYGWLMECADAEPEDEPSEAYKIPCPYRNNCMVLPR